MKIRVILAGAAAAAVMCAALPTVSAEETEITDYVAFTAIKSTIGQGFTVEPLLVPIYEGDTGLDVVERAADIQSVDSDYGAYIIGFADTDTGADVPEEIAAVCHEMSGRNTEGYLSSADYTAESGWSYFLNGEYAQVGISDYVPHAGDVLEFRFTVYGYGADLGVDNSSWGGASALVDAVDASDLIWLCTLADEAVKQSDAYVNAMAVLSEFGASQEEIDNAAALLMEESVMALEEIEDTQTDADTQQAADTDASDTGKGSPDTGVEGLAVVFGAVVIAGGALCLAKKK